MATTDLRRTYYRGPYGVAAVYDVVFGVVFLFFAKWAFESISLLEGHPVVNERHDQGHAINREPPAGHRMGPPVKT